MEFKPQNKLEEILIKAASDPAARPDFYKALAEANLFILKEGPPPESEGDKVFKSGESIPIRNIEWEGNWYIPVFSSLPRLQAAIQEERGYVSIKALDLFQLIQGTAVILNPGSEFGKAFTASEVASIADGSIWKPSETYRAEKDEEILLGQPANYPSELVDILSRYFKNHKQIKRAYLAHMHHPARGENPHTLIGIESSGNLHSILAGANAVIDGVHVPDPPVDFIALNGKSGIEGYFKTNCKPFYQRKVFGLF